MKLVFKGTAIPVLMGDKVTCFRGEQAVVTGWAEPRHSGSTGRVYTSDGEYYPSVYNLEWVE